MIRFDIVTQKHYESDLIGPEIENQGKRNPINTKIDTWWD
jgi:hypothetical protein